jgi:hypothetical protein
MRIATNAEIQNTLFILQRRSQQVIINIYSKLRKADVSCQPLMSALSEQEIVDLKQAYKSFNTFELFKSKYR